MRCFSSLGLLGNSGIKARLTAPPDLSQSSTPFSLLAPRHPPHALNSLATLLTPSPRVATRWRRSLTELLKTTSNRRDGRLESTIDSFASKARTREIIQQNIATDGRPPESILDATSYSPSCQRSSFGIEGPGQVPLLQPAGRPPRSPAVTYRQIRRKSLGDLRLRLSRGVFLVSSRFFVNTSRKNFFRDSVFRSCGLWRKGDSNP